MDIAIGYDADEKDMKLLIIGKKQSILILKEPEIRRIRDIIEKHFAK